MNFIMYRMIVSAFVLLYTGNVVNGRCRGEEDCAKNECCVAMYIHQLTTEGECLKLSEEGKICQVNEAKINYYGGKYIYSCPCNKGLVCKKTDNANATHDPPTRNCLKVSTDVHNVSAVNVYYHKNNGVEKPDALKIIARKTTRKDHSKRKSASEDYWWKKDERYSDDQSWVESDFDETPMDSLPEYEAEESKIDETDSGKSPVWDDLEDVPTEDDSSSSHRQSHTGVDEYPKEDELAEGDLDIKKHSKKSNASRPIDKKGKLSQALTHRKIAVVNKKAEKTTQKNPSSSHSSLEEDEWEDNPFEGEVSLSNGKISKENKLRGQLLKKDINSGPSASADTYEWVSDSEDRESTTDFDSGEEPKQFDSTLGHMESTEINLKVEPTKRRRVVPIHRDSSLEDDDGEVEVVQENDSEEDKPLVVRVDLPTAHGYDDTSFHGEQSTTEDDPKDHYVVYETDEDEDQSSIWDYL